MDVHFGGFSSVPVASSRLRALEAQQLHWCWPCIREALGDSADSERMEVKKSLLFSEPTYIPSAACQASGKALESPFFHFLLMLGGSL